MLWVSLYIIRTDVVSFWKYPRCELCLQGCQEAFTSLRVPSLTQVDALLYLQHWQAPGRACDLEPWGTCSLRTSRSERITRFLFSKIMDIAKQGWNRDRQYDLFTMKSNNKTCTEPSSPRPQVASTVCTSNASGWESLLMHGCLSWRPVGSVICFRLELVSECHLSRRIILFIQYIS